MALDTLTNFPKGIQGIPSGGSQPNFIIDRHGNAYFAGNITAQDISFDDQSVNDLTVTGNLSVTGTTTLTGAATAASTVGITGLLSLSAGLNLGTAQAIDATTSIILNEAGGDVDIRIESDTNANHFVSDAGLFSGVGAFGFGRAATGGQFLTVNPPALTTGAALNFAKLYFGNTDTMTVGAGTAPVVASLYVDEPNITLGGNVVTVAATHYIGDAPTEGIRNGALYVAAGDVVLSATTLGTTATSGFTWVPVCAGTPTGIPANSPTLGARPLVYNTTAGKLQIFHAGSWGFV